MGPSQVSAAAGETVREAGGQSALSASRVPAEGTAGRVDSEIRVDSGRHRAAPAARLPGPGVAVGSRSARVRELAAAEPAMDPAPERKRGAQELELGQRRDGPEQSTPRGGARGAPRRSQSIAQRGTYGGFRDTPRRCEPVERGGSRPIEPAAEVLGWQRVFQVLTLRMRDETHAGVVEGKIRRCALWARERSAIHILVRRGQADEVVRGLRLQDGRIKHEVNDVGALMALAIVNARVALARGASGGGRRRRDSPAESGEWQVGDPGSFAWMEMEARNAVRRADSGMAMDM
jgi:hypothetical protein